MLAHNLNSPTTHKLSFNPSNTKNTGIEIIELNDLYEKNNVCDTSPDKPHRISFNCLIYIEQGHGSHFIDFKNYSITAGSFVFINKHQTHAFDFINKPQGKLILFTDDFINEIKDNIRTPLFGPTHLLQNAQPTLTLSGDSKESCDNLLKEIEKALTMENSNQRLTQLLFASVLLIAYKNKPSLYQDHIDTTTISRFLSFMSLVEKHHTLVKDANNYAHMLHISHKTLNQICKSVCQKTSKQLIDAHIVLEAKRRLVVENKKVQDAAYSLGFNEATNFVKFFKRHTGMTPSQFKTSKKG